MNSIKKLAFILLIAGAAGVCVPVHGQATLQGLPLYEPWDQGTFAFNSWAFDPAQSNWAIDVSQGNPLPTSVFTGNPALQNYDVTLKSTLLDGKPWECANIYLEYDYKLSDISGGGTEMLTAGCYINGLWYPAITEANFGSTGWVHQKLDISQVCRYNFQIGFRVSGVNSAHIDKWSIDNIKVTAECKGPVACGFSISGKIVHVYWQHPQCDSLAYLLGYNLYRAKWFPGPFAKLNAALIADTEYFDHLPQTDTCTIFYYFVTAIHRDPETNLFLCEKACDTMLVDLATGIKPVTYNSLRIFPNPASAYVDIASDTPVEWAEVVNYTGKAVMQINPAKKYAFTIPVSNLPGGIYLLKIKNASGIALSRLSVTH